MKHQIETGQATVQVLRLRRFVSAKQMWGSRDNGGLGEISNRSGPFDCYGAMERIDRFTGAAKSSFGEQPT